LFLETYSSRPKGKVIKELDSSLDSAHQAAANMWETTVFPEFIYMQPYESRIYQQIFYEHNNHGSTIMINTKRLHNE